MCLSGVKKVFEDQLKHQLESILISQNSRSASATPAVSGRATPNGGRVTPGPSGRQSPASQTSGQNCISHQLLELALYFLIWSEAANLRHTPELLWFIFRTMRTSTVYVEVCIPGMLASQNTVRGLSHATIT